MPWFLNYKQRVPRALAGLITLTMIAAQPAPQGVSDPTAPENLRCSGANLQFDPETEQIVYVWQNAAAYPRTLDDQGPKGVALDRNCNLYLADTVTSRVIK